MITWLKIIRNLVQLFVMVGVIVCGLVYIAEQLHFIVAIICAIILGTMINITNSNSNVKNYI